MLAIKKRIIGNKETLFVFLIFFILYIKTLSPTVYWGDSGELTASAYVLGIAHWPGYPLYNVLGKIFTFIPVGSIAFRLNLMSAFFGALAVCVLYEICRLISDKKLAFVTSVIFGTSYTFWSQATIAEVYTHYIFLIFITTLFLLKWEKSKQNKYLYMFSFFYGLSLAHHLSSINFAPAFVVFILASEKKIFLKYKQMSTLFLIFLIPFIVYLYLPLRSISNPAVDWGNPENFKNFVNLISVHDLRFRFYKLPFNQVLFQLKTFFEFLFNQFPILLGLSIPGIYYLAKKKVKLLVLTSLVAIVNTIQFINYYTYDLVVHFIPVFLIFSIWIGFGIKLMLSFMKIQKKNALVIGLVLLVILLKIFFIYPKSISLEKVNYILESPKVRLPLIYHYMYPQNLDRSSFAQTSAFADYVFASLPGNSILVGGYDDICFVLWYYQICEGKRTDVTVIYKSLLSLKWYRENLKTKINISLKEDYNPDDIYLEDNNRPMYSVNTNPAFIQNYNSKTLPIKKIK